MMMQFQLRGRNADKDGITWLGLFRVDVETGPRWARIAAHTLAPEKARALREGRQIELDIDPETLQHDKPQAPP